MNEAVENAAPASTVEEKPRKSGELTAWQRFSFGVVRGALHLVARAIGFSGLYQFSRGFAVLEYLINYKRRRRVAKMIRTIFAGEISPAELRRHTRRHFIRERADKVFYLIFDLLPPERLAKRFKIDNTELVQAGYARGKGIFSLTSHYGSPHVMGLCLGLLGYRVGAIRDPHEGAMRRYIQDLWEAKYPDAPRPRVLYSGDFARQIFRLLKENYGMGASLDVTRMRDPRLKTLPVEIFGETRQFLIGTLQIALRCNAMVVQSFVVSEPNFHYRLKVIGPMADPDTATEDPALMQEIMQRYADNITAFAREHPDHVTRA